VANLITYELSQLTVNDDPSGLRLLGVASVEPLLAIVISLASKAESEPFEPAASMSDEPE